MEKKGLGAVWYSHAPAMNISKILESILLFHLWSQVNEKKKEKKT